jgi:hypothetical protein
MVDKFMQVGTHLNFSKCSLAVEYDGHFYNYVLKPHNKIGELSFIEYAMFVSQLLREGLPIVHASNRDLLANQLQKLASFCAGSGFKYAYESVLRFMRGMDFIEASRTVQALIVMDSLLGGRFAYGANDDNRIVQIKGWIEDYYELSFIRDSKFKREMTSAHFRQAFGEAIIPEGEHLIVKSAHKETIIESGTTLRFRAIRHFDSTPSRDTYFVDADCYPIYEFDNNIAYIGRAELEVNFAPWSVDQPPRTKVYGTIPLHWLIRTTDGAVREDQCSDKP